MHCFKDKVVLVTGAARMRGIGHATAVQFAQAGAKVVVNGRDRLPSEFPNEEKEQGWKGLSSVVEEIEALGSKGLAITADVSDSRQVHDMVDKAIAEFGHIDVLVSNAAVGVPGAFLDLKEQDWRNTFRVNLDSVFYCCQAVVKYMVERGKGGAIVNIAARLGKMGAKNWSAYSASKFGVIGLTQSLACELGQYNIRVNAICPGRTITNMAYAEKVWAIAREKNMDFAEAAKIVYSDYSELVPLGRPGYPEEVARAIVFLASDEASYITGQSINVDGGRLTAH